MARQIESSLRNNVPDDSSRKKKFFLILARPKCDGSRERAPTGTPYNGLYGEAPPERDPFQASAAGVPQGRNFTS